MTTKIGWVRDAKGRLGKTWNPTRGCEVCSPGCAHCYAMGQAHRFSGEGHPYHGLTVLTDSGPRWTGDVSFVPDTLAKPLRWQKPCMVFVDSMSDLFYERFTNEQIAAVFGVMMATQKHTYQLLTKRAERMEEWFRWVERNPFGICYECAQDRLPVPHPKPFFAGSPPWDATWPLSNLWIGVSVENQKYADRRIPQLLRCPAKIRFLSCEPLLGPIDLTSVKWDGVYTDDDGERHTDGPNHAIDVLRGGAWHIGPYGGFTNHSDMPGFDQGMINWVIVGGESGPKARPTDLSWMRAIVEECAEAETACFVKQLGKHPRDGNEVLCLQETKGGDPDEWPEDLRVRQMPEVSG